MELQELYENLLRDSYDIGLDKDSPRSSQRNRLAHNNSQQYDLCCCHNHNNLVCAQIPFLPINIDLGSRQVCLPLPFVLHVFHVLSVILSNPSNPRQQTSEASCDDMVQGVLVAVEEVGCSSTSCPSRIGHRHEVFTCMEVLEQEKLCSWTCFTNSCKFSFPTMELGIPQTRRHGKYLGAVVIFLTKLIRIEKRNAFFLQNQLIWRNL